MRRSITIIRAHFDVQMTFLLRCTQTFYYTKTFYQTLFDRSSVIFISYDGEFEYHLNDLGCVRK